MRSLHINLILKSLNKNKFLIIDARIKNQIILNDEELDFKTFLNISSNKFSIYLFDIKNSKNLYKNEFKFNENQSHINLNDLDNFISFGASPRASINLSLSAKANAFVPFSSSAS